MRPALYTLFLRSGRNEERSPYGVLFPGRGPWKGLSFFGVCEATSGTHESLCAWALEEVQRYLAKSRASLTTALNHALIACHTQMLQAQEGRPEGERVGLGMIVGALRTEELTLAWAGPGMICLKEEQTLHLLPRSPGGAIGQGSGPVQVSLRRFSFPPATAVLVCQSHLRPLITLQGLEVVLSAGPQQALSRLHALLREDPAFAAVLVG